MSNRDINVLKNKLLENRIEISDTISQFMEKCNNNFSAIIEWGGGPAGTKGEGDQGVPTKPKVPIHVWREGKEYTEEVTSTDEKYEIIDWNEDLTDVKYQEGHLIMLGNAHVYILEYTGENNFDLRPKFIVALQSYNSNDIVNGANAYVHIAYANSSDGSVDFTRSKDLIKDTSTYNLKNGNDRSTYNLKNGNDTSKSFAYMGLYSGAREVAPAYEERGLYAWTKILGGSGPQGLQGEQGPAGPAGPTGPKGDPGDGYTGQPFFIDLEGDISTINIDIDRTRLYDDINDYCECILHAYYGNDTCPILERNVTLDIPKDDDGNDIGTFELVPFYDDIKIKFVPNDDYVFPTTNIKIPITVNVEVTDNNKTYNFERKTIWVIKPIMETFELEIRPSNSVIKISNDGERYPKNLKVDVWKIEGTTISKNIDLSKESGFTLLWKYHNNESWNEYTAPIPTENATCIETMIVRHWDPTKSDEEQEIWDYEDIWTIADGKGTHYFRGDLGSTESLLVLTTGEKHLMSADSEDVPENYIAELRDANGYNIIFEPHFYDGSTSLQVKSIVCGFTENDIENIYNGRFKYEFTEISSENDNKKYEFKVNQVPYGVSIIPLSFIITGVYVELDQNGEPKLDSNGNPITEEKVDTVSFNVYISTISNAYTLQPDVTSFNTSKGVAYDKDNIEAPCDKIGCSVFKNGQKIAIEDLSTYNLKLIWIVHQENGETYEKIYTEPLVFGYDNDINKDHFQSDDVMIVFKLYYDDTKEIVTSTVPLIKDGVDGRDGESWQYIFVRSNRYPFPDVDTLPDDDKEYGILNPSKWKKYDEERKEYISDDPNRTDNTKEYLGPDGSTWIDDHQGVDEYHKYEYQSYRKWDANKKEWGIYYPPTLYSNYAKDGVDGSGFLTTFSNPVAIIPVGDNGYSCDENTINQKDSTEVYFYNGPQNLSAYENFKVYIDPNANKREHFSVKRNVDNNIWNIFFEPVVPNADGSKSIFDFGEDGKRFSIDINVEYTISSDIDGDSKDELFEGLVRWTLSPIKGLEDYEIFVDSRVVNTTVNKSSTFRVGYYKISSSGGKTFVEEYNSADGMNIKIHNSIEPEELKDINVESNWSKCSYDFTSDNRCYVILLDKKNNIIDYTSIESVADGEDGKDGYNGYHLELTQDYIALPWNETKTGVNSKYDDSKETGKPISSKMILYTDKSKEVNSGITYEILGLNENISSKTDTNGIFEKVDGILTGKFTIPKEMFNGDKNLTCRATYQEVVYEKVLFVDLEDTPYELEINKSILQRDKDTGKLIDNSILVKVKYWIDGIWKYTDEGKVVLTCDSLGNDMLSGNEPNDKHLRTIFFDDNRLLYTDDSNVRISYYLTDSKGNIIGEELSYEIIGILDNGKTGSSPYRLDLSNENVTLACDSEGNIYGTGYDKDGIDSDSDPSDDVITTTVTLFYGDEPMSLSKDNLSVTYNNKDIESDLILEGKDGIIEYTLPANFLNSLTGANNSINFKVKKHGSIPELNATMSIGKIKSQYRYYLRPSVSSVVRYEDDTYSVSNGIIKCALWKQDGSKKPVEVTDSNVVSNIIKYKFTEDETARKYNYNKGVTITGDCKEIWFEAQEGEVLWDREIVPVLKDGKDGSSPSCIAVEVLGYSKVSGLPLEEGKDFENGVDKFTKWKSSIDQIDADKGEIVYILQEFTWEPVGGGEQYHTRGITSTLAGVQGSNGRILFYIGSFKPDTTTGISTLTGNEVYGRLTKTVCDYYIDYDGNAWMRTGSEDTDGSDGMVGYKFGSQNSPAYWEKAREVGFIKANAITADMINVGSLVADEIFVNKLNASEIAIEQSIVGKLDDKITTSTAFANIKADNEKSLAEFRNTFTTEDDVTGAINSAKSGIISEARKDLATASMISEVDGKIASFETRVANGEATIAINSDNFTLTPTGDVTITGNITAKELVLVDGSGNNNEFEASFVFEEVVSNEYGKVLSPVLRWRNSGGTYELDMSSLIKKLNTTTELTGFFVDNTKLYIYESPYATVKKLKPFPKQLYQKWYVRDHSGTIGSRTKRVDNTYYIIDINGSYVPLTGEYYIEVGQKSVISPVETGYVYTLHENSETGRNEYIREDNIEWNILYYMPSFGYDLSYPRAIMFLQMGVFGKFDTDKGEIKPSEITGSNYIFAYIGSDLKYTLDRSQLPSTQGIPDGTYTAYATISYDLEKYTICTPSDITIPNTYFNQSCRDNEESRYWAFWAIHYGGSNILERHYENTLINYVDIYIPKDPYGNDPTLKPGYTSDIIFYSTIKKGDTHCTYNDLMGDDGSDSDYTGSSKYTWLKGI